MERTPRYRVEFMARERRPTIRKCNMLTQMSLMYPSLAVKEPQETLYALQECLLPHHMPTKWRTDEVDVTPSIWEL